MTWRHPNNRWPDDQVELLRQMFDAGYSCGRMAKELHITRNAVIGKLHREGMRRKKPPTITAAAPKPRHRPVRTVPFKRSPAKLEPPPWDGAGLSVLELTDDTCKFAMNDAAPYVFCGAPSLRGWSWCAHHYGRVFAPVRSHGRPYYPQRNAA